MKITIPELSLVVLVGPSGAGKSTFARKHFLETEIVSSDYCRAIVSDDENNQSASADAFDVLHFIAAKRLKAGKLTVIDATSVQPEARKPLVALAKQFHCIPVAIVLDMPERLCRERNATRTDRSFGGHVIRNQRNDLHRSIRHLDKEGFRHIHILRSPEDVADAVVHRQPLWNNLKQETGPFDIIGDVHGCFDELASLVERLGYAFEKKDDRYSISHPDGRRLVFVGDLVDRGPSVPESIRFVRDAVASGAAFCVAGNHDVKLVRALRGRNVKLTHGLAESMQQLESESEDFRKSAAEFLDGLVSHYVLDGGKLVVAHAGLREEMHGRGSGRVREFALYGETTGEVDEYGLPVRAIWAADYRGRAMIVYGHTPVVEPEWLNNTICIDTGCVFGGKLTALRYPERELVSVDAAREYYKAIRPLTAPVVTVRTDDLLDLSDVSGKRTVHTSLIPNITIREGNAASALEAMSRFSVNPQWLIYLPPTMSPADSSKETGFLEHIDDAISYYAENEVPVVVCEQKHMGSRAVIIVCKSAQAANRRFGAKGDERGIIYSRTGRRFFSDRNHERETLNRLATAIDRLNWWDDFKTDWFCFDTEIMPWSLKAVELLRSQYAAVGTSAMRSFAAATDVLKSAKATGLAVDGLQTLYEERKRLADRYSEAYAHYCWKVETIDDLRIAPFHLLAAEGKVYSDHDHEWHMEHLHRLSGTDPDWLIATPYMTIKTDSIEDKKKAVDWWLQLTESGGEGLVVKPLDFIAKGRKGLVQPAVKSRGREYLRIIYGPEYTLPHHLERLRERSTSGKRRLALKEFSLGLEALERFVKKEPLRRVHECVFGVLAMESEPVDPRL